MPLAPELSAAGALLVAVIFIFGGTVKGATGFGLPLTTISLLPLVVPLDLALALNTLVVPITNAAQSVAYGPALANIRICLPLVAGVAATVFLAAAAVASVGEEALRVAMGLLLIGFAALSFAAPRLRVSKRMERPAGFAAGMAGGVAGAAFTAPGPIYAMWFAGLGLERRRFIGAMGVAMFASGLLVSGAFWASGILDGPRAAMSAACALPAFLGMWIGERLARRLDQETFRRIILLMLAGLGLRHLWIVLA